MLPISLSQWVIYICMSEDQHQRLPPTAERVDAP